MGGISEGLDMDMDSHSSALPERLWNTILEMAELPKTCPWQQLRSVQFYLTILEHSWNLNSPQYHYTREWPFSVFLRWFFLKVIWIRNSQLQWVISSCGIAKSLHSLRIQACKQGAMIFKTSNRTDADNANLIVVSQWKVSASCTFKDWRRAI